MPGLVLTDAGKQMFARHWNSWVVTRLRDHANGLHADNPSTICPDCRKTAELERAS